MKKSIIDNIAQEEIEHIEILRQLSNKNRTMIIEFTQNLMVSEKKADKLMAAGATHDQAWQQLIDQHVDHLERRLITEERQVSS